MWILPDFTERIPYQSANSFKNGTSRDELDSPNLGDGFDHVPTPRRNGLWLARIIGPLPCLSPKRSQNLTSPPNKATASDRPSSLLRENAYTARYHLSRSSVEGRKSVIFTDHRSLIYTFNKKSVSCSPRELRQLDFISQFSTDIGYVSCADNDDADALSRIFGIMLSTANLEDKEKVQQVDEESQSFYLIRKSHFSCDDSTSHQMWNCIAMCQMSRMKAYMKKDVHASYSKMVYRIALRIPGQFFNPSLKPIPEST
ncbi:hypothetical protein AVEN_68324-1 [Araneus ventricosus]|uniref:Reverse transcriptase RNase H-like domain-containing protein n=1 Tax=Araneus ventricosus TaxID=182803 RepID=A0A4Y2GIM8_ARAVE|nr:hypothetical protein AVEN_68324-1 [Araneus ventricosus]